jgi:cobalt/nickel transport system permease protein
MAGAARFRSAAIVADGGIVSGHHGHGLFEGTVPPNGPLQRLPAGPKLLTAVLLILICVLVPPQTAAMAVIFQAVSLVLVLIAGLSLIPLRLLFYRLLLLEPFAIFAASLALFRPHGTRVFTAIVLRTTLTLSTAILLAYTTPFEKLLAVFRRMHLPAILLVTLTLMYRYLVVLGEESQRMKRARMSRSFANHRSQKWKMQSTLLAQLFVRTGDRAGRIHAAMCSRGWKG